MSQQQEERNDNFDFAVAFFWFGVGVFTALIWSVVVIIKTNGIMWGLLAVGVAPATIIVYPLYMGFAMANWYCAIFSALPILLAAGICYGVDKRRRQRG